MPAYVVLHVSCIATASSGEPGIRFPSLVYSLTRSKFEHAKLLQAKKLAGARSVCFSLLRPSSSFFHFARKRTYRRQEDLVESGRNLDAKGTWDILRNRHRPLWTDIPGV